MGTYINTLLHSSGGDLARPTKFRAMFSSIGISDFTLTVDRDLDLLCKTFSIPERKRVVLDYKYKGIQVPIQGPVDVEHILSVTFILDENHNVRKQFESWMESNTSFDLGETLGNFGITSNITRQLTIKALPWDEDGETYSYYFKDIFPVSIGELQYATDSVSSYQELTIQFAYHSYTSNPLGFDLLNEVKNIATNVIGSVAGGIVSGAKNFISDGISSVKKDLFGFEG